MDDEIDFSLSEKLNDNIINAFNQKKLILFLGAGVSRLMGIPCWSELADELIKEAFPSYAERIEIFSTIKSSKDKITIAYQYLCDQKKEKEFFDILGKYLKPKNDFKSQKDNVYQLLADFNAIYLTTNADNLFEKVLDKSLCHTDLNVDLLKSDFKGIQELFYLHGRYNYEKDAKQNGLVFTADQYIKRYNDSKFIEFLKELFISEKDRVIIFIGYGLNEYELIDYLFTKTGMAAQCNNNKFYILEGFCSNQFYLYTARKLYLKNLGVEVLPYNMDEQGYDKQIDIIKGWLGFVKSETIKPSLDYATIQICTNSFSEPHLIKLVKFLKSSGKKLYESQIVDLLKDSKDIKKWIEGFYSEGLYNTEYCPGIISSEGGYRAPNWPLLNLLAISCMKKELNKTAVKILDKLIPKILSALDTMKNYSVTSNISQIIFSLNNKILKPQYFDFIRKISDLCDSDVIFVDNYSKTKIMHWSNSNFKVYMECLLKCEKKIDDLDTTSEYYIKEALNQLLPLIATTKKLTVIYLYFNILRRFESYSLLNTLENLDNICKDSDNYSRFVYDTICRIFSECPTKQNEILNKLLKDKAEVLNKIGIHLIKINGLPLDILLKTQINYFDKNNCYFELYSLIKDKSDKKQITKEQSYAILKMLLISDMGDGNRKYKISEEYKQEYNKYNNSRKIKVIELLPIKNIKDILVEKQAEGFNADYDPKAEADEFDNPYYKVVEDDYTEQLYYLINQPLNQWGLSINHFFEVDKSNGYFCGLISKITGKVFSYEISDIETIFDSFLVIDEEWLNEIILRLKLRERIEYKDIIIKFCGKVLNKLIYKKNYNNIIIKNCLNLFIEGKEFLTILDYETNILPLIKPLLSINIDFPSEKNKDEPVSQLLNSIDGEKFDIYLNYLISKRKILNRCLTNFNDIEKIKKENGTILPYFLSFKLEILFYLYEEKTKGYLDYLFKEEDNSFSIEKICLSCLGSDYVYKDVASYLKKNNIIVLFSEKHSEIKSSKLSDAFLSKVFASFCYGMFESKDISILLNETNFCKKLIETADYICCKNNINLKIIEIWNDIKTNNKQKECAKAFLSLINNITEIDDNLLDAFVEASDLLHDFSFVYFSLEKLFKYLKKNDDNVNNKINRIILNVNINADYVSQRQLDKVVNAYKENNMNTQLRELFNKVFEKNKISLECYSKYNSAEIITETVI